MSAALTRVVAAWNRFWFEPQETSTVALFRIAFGLVTTLWTLSLMPNLLNFFGANGVVPDYPREGVMGWGLLAVSDNPGWVGVVFAATLAGSLALTVGLHSRLAAVVVLIGLVSFVRRNPWVFNSGDALLCNLAIYCVLMPTGVALSLDRLRTAPGRFWEFPARAPWALRLAQIQLSVIYLATVWEKLQGETWRTGTAVSYSLRYATDERFPVPAFVTNSPVLVEILTFSTLAIEVAIGVLVWKRALRPWVLALGVSLHLGIEVSIYIGFFTAAMFVTYVAFVPPDTARRLILAVRDRVNRRRAARRRDGDRPRAKKAVSGRA